MNTQTSQDADVTEDPEEPVFRGTPEDWWDAAEEIPESHAEEQNLGDWYIRWIRGSAGTTPAFRVATPSRPPNMTRRHALATAERGDPVSEQVRRLIKSRAPVPAWMKSEFVLADIAEGNSSRGPWHRKNNGMWKLVTDSRISVNDHTMSKLHPKAATFS